MKTTLGQRIGEMESDLEACRAADVRIKIWQTLFEQASPYEKKGMLMTMLKEIAGFTAEDIKKLLTP